MKQKSICQAVIILLTCLFITPAGHHALAGCSAPQDDACPFNIPVPPGHFDRCWGSALLDDSPTAWGNAVCDLRLKLMEAKKKLQDFPEPWRSQAEAELQPWIDATLRGAIDQEAINTLNNANHYLDIILEDINGYINDPVCGVHGTIQKVDDWLKNRAREFNTWGKLAQVSGEIVSSVGDAGASATEALARLTVIMADRNTYSDETVQSLQDLQKDLERYYQAIGDLADTDISAFTDGVSQGLELAQWVNNCGICAGLLADSVRNYGTGATTTVGGSSACPETIEAFGGSCWGIPGGVVVAGFGVLEDAVATGPCTAAKDGAAHAPEYGRTLVRVVETVQELINKTLACYTRYNLVVAAIEKLAANASGDIGSRIGPVRDKFEESGRHLENARQTLNEELFPVVEVYAQGRIEEFSRNIGHVLVCRDRAHQVALETGQDVVNASGELVNALAHAVEAAKVVGNIQSGIERGWKNVSTKAALRNVDDFKEVRSQINAWAEELAQGVGAFFTGNWQGAVNSANRLVDSLASRLQEIVRQTYRDFKAGYTCESCTNAQTEFGYAKTKAGSALNVFRQKVRQYSPSVAHPPVAHVDMAVGNLPSLSMPGSVHLKHMPRFTASSAALHKGRGSGSNTGIASSGPKTSETGQQNSLQPEKAASGNNSLPILKKTSNHHVRVPIGGKENLRLEGRGMDRITRVDIVSGRNISREIRATIRKKTKNRVDLQITATSRARAGKYGVVMYAGKRKYPVPDKLVRLEVTRAQGKPVATKPGKKESRHAKASPEVKVRRASTRHLEVVAGQQQDLRLDGANLNLVSKVVVMAGKKSVHGALVSINRKARGRLDLTVATDKRVKNGSYTLRLLVKREHVDLPARLVTIEVTRPKPVARKQHAAAAARGTGLGKGHSAKAGGSKVPSVQSARPGHAVLVPGGKELTVTLKGSHLDKVSKPEVVSGTRSARQIRARIRKKSSSSMVITLKADAKAGAGNRYQLRIHAGNKPVTLAAGVLSIEVKPAGKTGRHHPAKR
jgi:hypothetical protein